MIQILMITGFFFKIINWLLNIFDNLTGIVEFQKGRVATFVQFTRSKNLLLFPLKLISGRNKGDCIYLSLMSFFLPLYVHEKNPTDYDFILSIIVLYEQLSIKKKEEETNDENWIYRIISYFLRIWIILNFQYEETFNKYIYPSITSG
jgi:hypothetical protein